ncbi:MFS general substrate transporter [Coemansia reversa NRRL 1564]|uniref:MFS general substrate transporter n=1 Tax=Coemansia reversa (strain ATCC 12441 / NRRL 1564) TaxID=763665 RepID=A0A2G5B953_COERN|nr:MFS general substrate transporter [Coemansia reversa NRRL 1564]|eukprot:PIA15534.1 MFS general substrate transporter [Coemansia reversa NRRL 1564]
MSFHKSGNGADIAEISKDHVNDLPTGLDMDERDRDLLQRQRELEDLDDNTKVNWEMIKKLTVCGVAFLNDAYDMFAINIVAMILGFVYYHDAEGSAQNTVPKKWDTLIKIAVQIGCLLGQLVLGRLGDKIGRTTVYSASLMIAIITTIASAFSNSMVKGFNVFIVLFIWRVLLGFGIGGDYPLTATIVSEYASPKRRGMFISGVFSCQGFGNVLAPIVGIIVTACFKSSIDNDVRNLDYVWRLIIGLGCIPGVATLYWRLTMEDSKRFQMETAKAAAANADEDMLREKLLAKQPRFEGKNDEESSAESSKEIINAALGEEKPRRAKTFGQYFGEWRHLKVLLGTSIAWFALDVAFYGINLNSSVVIEAIGFAGNIREDKPSHFITRNCLGSIIINILGSVPGYWIAVFTIEKLGRKTIQLMGFGMLTILYIVLGFAYHKILDKSVAGFIVLFTLAQLFQNFGPNVTTFVIPGEVFPTRFRSTAHGISAAAGKLGAIVAQGGFMQLKDRGGKNQFIDHLLEIFALFMLIGFFVTFWIPESKGKTLEEICDEREEYY